MVGGGVVVFRFGRALFGDSVGGARGDAVERGFIGEEVGWLGVEEARGMRLRVDDRSSDCGFLIEIGHNCGGMCCTTAEVTACSVETCSDEGN